MGLDRLKTFPEGHLIASAIIFSLYLLSTYLITGQMALNFSPELMIEAWIVPIIYSLGTGFTAIYFWRRKLRSGILVSILLLTFFTVLRNDSLLYSQTGSILGTMPLISTSIGIIIFSGFLEYGYKNRKKFRELLSRKNVRHSIYVGWLHLVFGFCIYVIVYGPKYVNSSFLTVKTFSGITGCFILGSLTLYLYTEENLKLPVVLTTGWIIWGLYGFFTSMDSYPVNMLFPPPEFVLPPAPGYFFSSFIPLSLIIVYTVIRKSDLKIQNPLKY